MPIAKTLGKLFVYYQMWGVAAERYYAVFASGRQTFKRLQDARDFAASKGYSGVTVKCV